MAKATEQQSENRITNAERFEQIESQFQSIKDQNEQLRQQNATLMATLQNLQTTQNKLSQELKGYMEMKAESVKEKDRILSEHRSREYVGQYLWSYRLGVVSRDRETQVAKVKFSREFFFTCDFKESQTDQAMAYLNGKLHSNFKKRTVELIFHGPVKKDEKGEPVIPSHRAVPKENLQVPVSVG